MSPASILMEFVGILPLPTQRGEFPHPPPQLFTQGGRCWGFVSLSMLLSQVFESYDVAVSLIYFPCSLKITSKCTVHLLLWFFWKEQMTAGYLCSAILNLPTHSLLWIFQIEGIPNLLRPKAVLRGSSGLVFLECFNYYTSNCSSGNKYVG